MLTQRSLDEVFAHAESAWPNEACGFVRRDGRVERCVNVAADRRRAFALDDRDLIALARSFDSENPAVTIYHSHTSGAYFSAADARAAAPTGAPLYSVAQLVVDARQRTARLYEWREGRFCEV